MAFRAATLALLILVTVFVAPAGAQGTPDVLALDDLEPMTPENIGRIEELAVLGGGRLRDIVWSPDGRTLAVGSTLGVWLYNARHLDIAPRLLDHPSAVTSLAYSPDGTMLVTGSEDGRVRFWDTMMLEVTGYVDAELVHPDVPVGSIDAVAFSPDGRWLAFDNAFQISLYDLETAEQQQSFEYGCSSGYIDIDFSTDGDLLACSDHIDSHAPNGWMEIWDFESGERLFYTPQDWDQEIYWGFPDYVTISADNTLVVGVGRHWNDVYANQVWDRVTNTLLVPDVNEWWNHLLNPLFSPVASLLVAENKNGLVMWDYEQRRRLAFTDVEGSIQSKAFSPDGTRVALVNDQRVSVWTWETDEFDTATRQHSVLYETVGFSPDGRLLATIQIGGVVRLWDVENGFTEVMLADNQLDYDPIERGYQIASWSMVAFSPDSSQLAAATRGGSVRVWDLNAIRFGRQYPNTELAVHRDFYTVARLDFSSNEELRLIACEGSMGKRQTPPDDTFEIQLVSGHHCAADEAFAFSSDLSSVARAFDNRIIIYGEASDEEIDRFEFPEEFFSLPPESSSKFSDDPIRFDTTRFEFSHDGNVLAIMRGHDGQGCCAFSSNTVWQIGAEPVRLETIEEDWATLTSMTFSSDDDLLAAGSIGSFDLTDQTYIWNIRDLPETVEPAIVLRTHRDSIMDLEFNADNTLLATASYDGTVRLWGVQAS